MAAVLAYDPDRAHGAIDKILLRGAARHLSLNEISALTGGVVKPAAAGARIDEILDDRDWLSNAKQNALLIDDMMAVKDSLMESALKYSSVDHVKPLIAILNTLQKSLAADKIDVAAAMSQITHGQAQIMLAAISLTLERSLFELEKRYPDIPRGELTQIFQEAMPDAIAHIEGSVVD